MTIELHITVLMVGVVAMCGYATQLVRGISDKYAEYLMGYYDEFPAYCALTGLMIFGAFAGMMGVIEELQRWY